MGAALRCEEAASEDRIETDLRSLMAWAKSLGAHILIDFDDYAGGMLHIPDLWRDIQNPKTKGNGRIVLNRVIELADRERLGVEIEFMTDEAWLGVYYASFGFLPYGDDGDITNLRRPRRK